MSSALHLPFTPTFIMHLSTNEMKHSRLYFRADTHCAYSGGTRSIEMQSRYIAAAASVRLAALAYSIQSHELYARVKNVPRVMRGYRQHRR